MYRLRFQMHLLGLLVVILTLVACGGQSSESKDSDPLTLEALKNAAYLSEWPADGVAQLVEGEYREKYMPDSATELVIRLSDHVVFGDLNGDGVEDAVVVLVTDSGGSGVFFSLAAVINRDGEPENVATEYLGDRVGIEAMSIQAGEIVVEMIAHGPEDPMCCPSQNVTQKYKLQGEELIQ